MAKFQTTRVILIGVGGATCSGKTTLAKHLRSALPSSFIIHQDDFTPPQELIPCHPVYKVQDWDDAPGAIDWDRLASFLQQVKSEGILPPHHSHDHLNEQSPMPVTPQVFEGWRERFHVLVENAASRGERLVFALLDGFLLYWDERVIRTIDIPVFLRVPHDTLVARRRVRSGYHTAVQSDPEGTFWKDPPGYWEQIVYPAYVRAHEAIFAGGKVETGGSSGRVPGLVLIEGLDTTMTDLFARVCEVIEQAI